MRNKTLALSNINKEDHHQIRTRKTSSRANTAISQTVLCNSASISLLLRRSIQPNITIMAAGIGADSDILQAFEPGWLDQHGYINTDPTLLTTADRLYYLDSTHRKTAKWHAPLAPGTAAGTAHTPASLRSTAGIHPVFRREAWLNITRADYARLKPVLTLASRFLDEPAMLPFFHGVLDRASMETLRDAKAKRTTKLAPRELMRVFGKKKIGALPAAASSSGQQVAVWLMIRKLKDCVRFRVGGCTAPVYAVTNSDRRLPGFDNAWVPNLCVSGRGDQC